MNDIVPERPVAGPVTAERAQSGERELSGWSVFMRLLRIYKLLILSVTAVCVLVAVVYALTATPYFRAETIVTAVRPDTGGGAASLASDLAGAMGVNLLQSNGDVETANAVLTSRHLIEEFIKRNNLLPALTPAGKRQPTLWFAVKRIRDEIVTIKNDSKKGVTIVTVEWTDPVTAARWSNAFVAIANELIRTRALDESRRNISYLNGQLAQTNDVDIRRAIYFLVESETKKAMMANGKVEYAFQVVDPAVAPELKARPKRTLITVVGGLLGLLIGLGAAWAVDSRRPRPQARSA
jgi:uncharacterized protein involved in exopolysaccharide biosynthesis